MSDRVQVFQAHLRIETRVFVFETRVFEVFIFVLHAHLQIESESFLRGNLRGRRFDEGEGGEGGEGEKNPDSLNHLCLTFKISKTL